MVLSAKDLFMRRLSKSRSATECWLWPDDELNNSGYGQLDARRYKSRKRFLAHKLSYELFVGPVPRGFQVMHSCDVKRCVNPNHLELGTQLDNESQKVLRGRSNRGENRWCATLTNTEAQQMLDEYRLGKAYET